MVRSAFAALIGAQQDMDCVGEAADGVDGVALAAGADIVLMDIRMPRKDGIEATREIKQKCPARVLILTTFREEDLVLRAIEAGADGFLLKDSDPQTLLGAIRSLAAGEGFLDPAVTPLVLRAFNRRPASETSTAPAPTPGFTRREAEILELLRVGKSNRDIAKALVIAETTVKTHVANMLDKTGCRNRVELAVYTGESPED
ncbi:MAG TPA: response regulator transcription factor [Candidatus Corynebacterium avicola]|uniref:Response regulator transcription factor n=1 Tax=Candidatus Corynebacterium avicola TaxID=2838527 RepID=A0A9D1UK17_9CORY|nr:response regulator transcription factor [Candidatus Corynebacterium avicola]